jgi:protein arginine kinase activator
MQPHEPINKMLEKFVKIGAGMQEAARRQCPQCGLSFGEFRAQGLLGCAHDYEVFAELLIPLIERAHDGASHHVGKRPGQSDGESQQRANLRRIRRELEEAIAEERYEDAARLRDDLTHVETERSDEHR